MNLSCDTIQYLNKDTFFLPKITLPDTEGIILSDLHIPHHRKDLIDKTLKENSGKDFCVVAGDLLDLEHYSKFPKRTLPDLLGDYKQAFEIMEQLSKNFKKVIVIKGNHEFRIESKMMRDPNFVNMSFFWKPDLIYYLCKGYDITKGNHEQKHAFENVYYYESFDLALNDMIISHPASYLSTPCGTVKKAVEAYIQYSKEFKSIAIGHTHSAGWIRHLDIDAYEIGCLCYDMLSMTRLNKKKQTNGYMKVRFDGLAFNNNVSTIVVYK